MGTNGNQKATGKRARTRELFAKAFKTKGVPSLTRYLKIYRQGDIVDIKADPSIQRGLPYKCYHGKTGRVWNVTPRAVGVYLNKKVGHRYVMKKLLVRTEHVQHSTSRDDFLQRVKRNDAAKVAAKAAGRKFAPPLRQLRTNASLHLVASVARALLGGWFDFATSATAQVLQHCVI